MDHSKEIFALLDFLPNAIAIKHLDGSYIYANKNYIKLLSVSTQKEILSLQDDSILSLEMAIMWSEYEKEVLKGLKNSNYLCIVRVGRFFKYLYCITEPYFEDGVLVGVHRNITDFSHAPWIKVNAHFFKKQGKKVEMVVEIGRSANHQDLSQREEEVLFYFIRGVSIMQIANIFAVSNKTIETYIARMRAKFEVIYSSELVDKAIALGYLKIIPNSLISIDTSQQS
ncbi:helix-turn-helix domain-containing protein [Fangia hongkongensis]|uniref:helix-turn-helix domain-containing protein n=1 Tax=Fangia hongkongensis TaxID=270495 RepID=UPI00036513AF|nr:helix-turn-helix transcriptional regulator [Fangia hongkongensis]